jgi:hypothetical protein
MTVLLGLEPRNPLYDGGQTAFTPGAQAAFARYVRALAERWPGCVVAVEIGNEINGRNGMTGPAAATRAASHTALLKAVYQGVKPDHPAVALLGGSTNTVATGFLARLFAAGALEWVDGIAVHPYRPDPEGVDGELGRLRQAMARAGRMRPIWATEFSREFPDPALAPGWYLKMTALMESAGVADHFWYALADQPWFPTMGLLRFDGTAKPAARAFAFAARELAPLGPARRVNHGDPALFDFAYGTDTRIVWGGPRRLTVPAGARAFAPDGSPVPVPAAVGDDPVVIRHAATLEFGPAEVLADSLYGYGAAPLSWFARTRAGALLALAPIDWDWTGYLGNPALPQFSATAGGIGTTAAAGTVVRYTAGGDTAGTVRGAGRSAGGSGTAITAAVCLRPATAGMRASAALIQGGRTLWQSAVGPQQPVRAAIAATVRPGERIELVLLPAADAPLSRFRYRLRISRSPGAAVSC